MNKEFEKFTLDELMKEVYRRSVYNAEESQKALDETMSEKIDLDKEIERLNNIIDELDNKINRLELSELKYLDQIYTQDLKIIKLNNKILSIEDYLNRYYDVESENFILYDKDIYSEIMEKLKEDEYESN